MISAKGKVTTRHTDLAKSFAPAHVRTASAYEQTRKLVMNGRYHEFFKDVARLLSTADKSVLFEHPTALIAFSSEPSKDGAKALLRFCSSRWAGVKNKEKAAFGALCSELLEALTK